MYGYLFEYPAHQRSRSRKRRRSSDWVRAVDAGPAARVKRATVQGRRILVTGGAGFIGSRLVPRLAGLGAQVLVVDDLSVGARQRVPSGSAYGEVGLRVGDIRDVSTLSDIASYAPEIVVHLAAIHYVPYCIDHPEQTMEVNVGGFGALLQTIRESAVDCVIFASSAAVYGYSPDAFTEAAALRPDNVYGHSKVIGEELLRTFQEERPDVRTVALRFFNVFGPGETNPHVIPHLLTRHLAGEAVPLGSLWPKRDYVFVDDLVEAIVSACLDAQASSIFNIGSGVGTSVLDLTRTIGEISGRRVRINHEPWRERSSEGDLIADVSRIREHLHWRPRFDLRRGLDELLAVEHRSRSTSIREVASSAH